VVVLRPLAACRAQNVGSPKPPESFGKVDTAFVGCPKIDGRYRWPPKEGEVEGYKSEGTPRRDRYATPEFFGAFFNGPTEFEVRREGNELSVAPLSPPGARKSHAEQVLGSRAFAARSAFECSGGWVMALEREHPHSQARENYGGPAKLGAKLAPLEGGDLVVAQWVRVYERRGSIFSWGDQSVGHVPLPDQLYWRWARFERVPGADSMSR
jgi:hypothetical protein